MINISFLSLAYADDWGAVKGGLKARIVPLQSEYVIGRPMEFRLEVTNVHPLKVRFFPLGYNNMIIIKGPDGEVATYIDYRPIMQVVRYPATIEPGEVVVLDSRFDITRSYYIDKPGRYTIQFNGEFILPSSNVLEVEIEAGNLSDSDILTGHLVRILPKRWIITWRAQRDDGRSSEIHLYYNKTGTKGGDSLLIEILQFKEFTSAPQGYQYLGETAWGTYVYILLPDEVNSAWPNAEEEISKALKIVQNE